MKVKEKRIGYFALLVFSLILFVALSNFASGAAITVVSPASNTNFSGSALVVFNVSYVNGSDYNDALNATFYYNLSGTWTYINFTTDCNNGATFASCNRTINISSLTQGRYSINATIGNDTAKGASTITTNVVFDWTPPNVSFSGQTNAVSNGNYSGTITLNVSVNDILLEVKSVYFNVTNSSGTQLNFTKATASGDYYNATLITTGFDEGKYNITVYANDTLNNVNGTERIQIAIDRTAPAISLSKSSSDISSITVAYSCTDALSGSATCTLSSSSGTVSGSTISDFTCSNSYTITVAAIDGAGNTASTSDSFSTASCGGETITAVSLPKKVASFALISPEKETVLKDFDSRIGIKEMQISVSSEAPNVKVTVTKYSGQPAEVSVAKSGVIYQYLQIAAQNLNEKLEKAVVQFRVEKSWVTNNNLQKEDVAVYKFDSSGKTWNGLTTTYKSEDNIYYYYDVELASFSYFAIGEKAQAVSEGETIAETLTKDYLWVWIVIIAVVLVAAAFFLLRKKKK